MCSFLFTSSFILFYLDNFKLSNLRYLKFLQIFSIVFILSYVLSQIYNVTLSDLICYATDNKDINLHGHVTVSKEAGVEISKGIQTIGSQVGLGGVIAGVASAVAKSVTNTSLPPLQKAGIIVGSGLVAGLGHTALSSHNKNNIVENNTNFIASTSDLKSNIITSTSSTSSEIINSTSSTSSNVNHFLANSNISSLEEIFFNGEMMGYVCLVIAYILVIQIIFKLYFKVNINITNNLMNKLLNKNLKTKIEFYLNNIIKLNKQMSIV